MGTSKQTTNMSRPHSSMNRNALLSPLSLHSGKEVPVSIKKFYEPCYKRCPCLMHGEKVLF